MRHVQEFQLLLLKKKNNFMQMHSHCSIICLFGHSLAGQNVLICIYMLLMFRSSPHAVAQNSNQLPAFNYNFVYLGISLIFVPGCFFFFFLGVWFYSCSGTESHESINLHSGEDGMSRRGNGGLDLNLIEIMFPTLASSYVKLHNLGKGAQECAVCLTEFEDKDLIRLLPKCDHVFHPRCIDAWLSNHTTCPVCRANLISVSCEDPATSEEQQQVALAVVPDH